MLFKICKVNSDTNGVILSKKPLFCGGEEALVYSQGRLIKCFLEEDNAREFEVLISWCIIPELEEVLYEIHS